MKFNTHVYQESMEGDGGFASGYTSSRLSESTKNKIGHLNNTITKLTDENTILLKENGNLKRELDSFITKKKTYI